LDLPDVQTDNYVDLLDPVLHVTGPTRKVKRQRVGMADEIRRHDSA
jgi:hypothetical protein